MAGSVYSADADLNLDAKRLIELTDSDAAPNALGQSVIDKAAEDAQDEIDEALAGVYPVPFTAGNVPASIMRIHVRLKRYHIFEHRDAINIPEQIAKAYDESLAKLADYATPGDGGRILLGVGRINSGTGPTSNVGSFSSDIDDTRSAARVFGRYRDKLG